MFIVVVALIGGCDGSGIFFCCCCWLCLMELCCVCVFVWRKASDVADVQNKRFLQKRTSVLLLLFHLQCCTCCSFKDLTNSLFRFGRAFQISECINFLKHSFSFLRLYWLLFHLGQLLNCVWIISEIFFVAN